MTFMLDLNSLIQVTANHQPGMRFYILFNIFLILQEVTSLHNISELTFLIDLNVFIVP